MSNSYDSRPETYEHISKVRAYLNNLNIELILRSHFHDASKLVEPEVSVFDEFTPKLANTVYGSDEYKADLEAMGPALRHHYDHNRHHPEFHKRGLRDMNLVDLLEMVCDWYAASQRNKNGDVRKSIEVNKDRFGYDDLLAGLMRNTIDLLEGKGGGVVGGQNS